MVSLMGRFPAPLCLKTPTDIANHGAAADGRTPEGLKQIKALAGRTLDMLDSINALPNRQDRPRERVRDAVEAPERPMEAPRAVQAPLGAARS
jgi:hypothetical protein